MLRRALVAVAWLVAAVAVALGAAGLVAAIDHLPGGTGRPELTWTADRAVAKRARRRLGRADGPGGRRRRPRRARAHGPGHPGASRRPGAGRGARRGHGPARRRRCRGRPAGGPAGIDPAGRGGSHDAVLAGHARPLRRRRRGAGVPRSAPAGVGAPRRRRGAGHRAHRAPARPRPDRGDGDPVRRGGQLRPGDRPHRQGCGGARGSAGDPRSPGGHDRRRHARRVARAQRGLRRCPARPVGRAAPLEGARDRRGPRRRGRGERRPGAPAPRRPGPRRDPGRRGPRRPQPGGHRHRGGSRPTAGGRRSRRRPAARPEHA